jgi:hypothetical protein
MRSHPSSGIGLVMLAALSAIAPSTAPAATDTFTEVVAAPAETRSPPLAAKGEAGTGGRGSCEEDPQLPGCAGRLKGPAHAANSGQKFLGEKGVRVKCSNGIKPDLGPWYSTPRPHDFRGVTGDNVEVSFKVPAPQAALTPIRAVKIHSHGGYNSTYVRNWGVVALDGMGLFRLNSPESFETEYLPAPERRDALVYSLPQESRESFTLQLPPGFAASPRFQGVIKYTEGWGGSEIAITCKVKPD